jgi:hypothetical protein
VSLSIVSGVHESMPSMPDFLELVQKRKPDLEILGEMRQFWAELLQFCKC